MAYFDNQQIWFELLRSGIDNHSPDWLMTLVDNPIIFEGAMRALVDFCFVEVQLTTQSYAIHACVHDWTLMGLNHGADLPNYRFAFSCVANSIADVDRDALSHVQYTQLVPHAKRLVCRGFREMREQTIPDQLRQASDIAQLLQKQLQLEAAIVVQVEIRAEQEKILGPDHASTLNTVHNLGDLYADQYKLAEAEQMYTRALAGRAKALGPDHASTLDTVDNLGLLYGDQGKLVEAEQMYTRALAGREKALGPDHTSTLGTVNNLGLLYCNQDKLAEAEQMYTRALAECEKALRPDHTSALDAVDYLGSLYRNQGKLAEAEQLYIRALTGFRKALDIQHPLTLTQLLGYANLLTLQQKLEEAKQVYQQIIDIYSKSLVDATSPSELLVVTYAQALYRSVSILRATLPEVQSFLLSSIKHWQRRGRGNIVVTQYLVKVLLHLRDDDRAQQVLLCYVTQNQSDMFDLGGTRCDACQRSLDVNKGMNICRECVDTKLCDACISKSTFDMRIVRNCQHHQFYAIADMLRRSITSSDLQKLDWNGCMDGRAGAAISNAQ